jgi:aminopeptidase N
MIITKHFLKLSFCFLMILSPFYQVKAQQPLPEKGVSKQLALQRAANLSDINYQLSLYIPEKISESIYGNMWLNLNLKTNINPLVLDFNVPIVSIRKVTFENGDPVKWKHINGHLIIPASFLKKGHNLFILDFKVGEQSLNRNQEFLYSLFVPARASTAFPCFDQPDLKARFTLDLDIPEGWVATANGKQTRFQIRGKRPFVNFETTQPISTYLFSFVAGKFKITEKEHNDISYRFFYREADSLKMKRNTDSIFKQVFMSVDWMEKYTGIKQPFGKYDFIAIPSFQYGGMEHPGAILYNAQRLILDESATQEDELNRANLISHETAHLWFGDLVTMKWFDDVWLKEVFANFMADKIVNPMYPGMNHQLSFLLAHQTRAYAIDRTQGANPIQQKLNNLAEAGSLYGNIIYHKAPIVMDQLEQLMGEDQLQKGLQKYLQTYRFGNATWDDLISILGKFSSKDLKAWSNVWVKEPGMPHYVVSTTQTADHDLSIAIHQTDPMGKHRIWPQYLTVTIDGKSGQTSREIFMDKAVAVIPSGPTVPFYILPNSTERGYGYFELDPKSTTYLLKNIQTITDPLLRGTAWLSLREMMINNKIASTDYFNTLCSSLTAEKEEQLINFLVSDIQMTYWKFLNQLQRNTISESLSDLLLTKLNTTEKKSLKATFLKALINTTRENTKGMDTLYAIWTGAHPIPGLKLSDNDYRIIACELALRNYPDAKKILATQIDRIQDKDLKERLVYLLPSLSNDPKERDLFFKQLADPKMREHEPWVSEALGYLNHPLRESASEKYILPGLNLLEEIRSTGDIFFPVDWLNALLSGHSSPEAAKTVRAFLKNHPNYPPDLRMKILQSADNLLRRNPSIR